MQTWNEDGVRAERTGWRCQAISGRHRKWGFDCPAVDLDFVMTEYNYGKPVAIIEYKDKHAQPPNIKHPTYRALADLANNYNEKPLPFIIAIYCPEAWWFQVIPVNEAAKTFYKDRLMLTEQRFVKSLYLMRKAVLSAEDEKVISRLNSIQPTNDDLFLEAA